MERDVAILGGDVLWLVDDGIIQPTYDTWYLTKESQWSWQDYVMQSGDCARNYILSYSEKNEEKDCIFSLVTATEEQFAKLNTVGS